ncbi:hypothetical protein TNCV_792031 [Trichonephila clavipes]|nr:hypothetical protein TNCV_792031 [Trichonephila clavipes]
MLLLLHLKAAEHLLHLAPVNVFSLTRTGKSHTGMSLVDRGMWKHVSASFGVELFYQLGSMCWCVVVQKISVVTRREPRPFTTNAFPQTMSSKSVWPQRFVQVFGDDLFEQFQTLKQHFPRSVKLKVVKLIHCLQWILGPL